MGFASTAAYFESRANKTSDPDERDLLVDVAGFYRRLVQIASGFPPGYQVKSRESYPNRWRARAEECRAMADHFRNPQCRDQMTRLANSYEQMAVIAERFGSENSGQAARTG